MSTSSSVEFDKHHLAWFTAFRLTKEKWKSTTISSFILYFDENIDLFATV